MKLSRRSLTSHSTRCTDLLCDSCFPGIPPRSERELQRKNGVSTQFLSSNKLADRVSSPRSTFISTIFLAATQSRAVSTLRRYSVLFSDENLQKCSRLSFFVLPVFGSREQEASHPGGPRTVVGERVLDEDGSRTERDQ